ncbi:hypothetical protein GCM10027199_85450 [Amycolatopsis magusensis]
MAEIPHRRADGPVVAVDDGYREATRDGFDRVGETDYARTDHNEVAGRSKECHARDPDKPSPVTEGLVSTRHQLFICEDRATHGEAGNL